jgi:nucleoside-diphosphate-sugar epimerase
MAGQAADRADAGNAGRPETTLVILRPPFIWGAGITALREIAAPAARVLDRTAWVLRRRTAPPLTNWLIAFLGRDRSYDITRACADLGYRPGVSLAAGLDEMRMSASAL